MRFLKKSALVFGAIAISVISSPAKAWGPEYDSGSCAISIGKERKDFPCTIARGGGAGGYFMEVFDISQGSNNALEIGKYYRNTLVSHLDANFIWKEGRQEKVRGEKFNNKEKTWTIWIERGWSISFKEMPVE
jgi:hypothetical protein